MADLHAVLGYLADVAEEGSTTPRTQVDGLVWIGWTGHTADSNVFRIDNQGARKLAATDALHREEHLIREGWIWLRGDIDGRSYRWPIVSRRVQLLGNALLPKALESHTTAGLAPRAISGWDVTPGLLERDQIDELDARESDFGRDMLNPAGESFLDAAKYPRVTSFVKRYLSAAGLPKVALRFATGSVAPRSSGEPSVVIGSGYYLERHPFEANRSSVLKVWRSRIGHDTALGHLYAPEDGAVPADDTPVLSPLPLNDEQRRAARMAQSQKLTVVAGPPGTGKSHLAAAIAINEVAHGRSVLIASQSIHACDVIHDLLQRFPMVEALRFGHTGSARQLGDRLAAGVEPPDDRYDEGRLRRRLDELADEVADQRRRIGRRLEAVGEFDRALRRRDDLPLSLADIAHEDIDVDDLRAAVMALDADGLFGWLHRRRAQRQVRAALGRPLGPADDGDLICDALLARQRVDEVAGKDLGLSAMWHELEVLEDRWRHLIGDRLEAQRRDRAGLRTRAALSELAATLRSGSTMRRQQLAELGDRFLDVAPLWLGTLGEIESTLPIKAGLFDLVILDEASQISQLSAVPALARARRAVVVGDSRQLRHVSFVASETQERAAVDHAIAPELARRLDDRANSLFDAAAAVAPVVNLAEHFRSAPHIIGFSNRLFYDGGLRLMTQHPAHEARDAIEVRHVGGERDGRGVVTSEVDAVVGLLHEHVAGHGGSIGIVAPFRAQADAIEARIIDTFTLEEIDRHAVRVGTVHAFQGSERDVTIISLGLGADDTQARRFLEDPALFNVMVTRARSQVVVITGLAADEFGSGLLADYVRHSNEPPSARREVVHASGWTERLATELASGGDRRIITNYEVAGDTIDIVVGEGNAAFGIETELHSGGVQRHIDRHMVLRRAGWEITDVFRASAYGREEELIAQLLARISRPGSGRA